MIIAIDVGGTKISAALIHQGNIIEQRKIDSVVHTDLQSLAKRLWQLCSDWQDKANALAVACTGQVGSSHVNFLSVKQKLPLKEQLTNLFNLPTTIINDAAAAAWAEYKLNNTKDDTLVYITVSTGIGGGIIQNGQLVTSLDGFCAHLGHMSVSTKHNDIRCHCGRLNCVEAISSGTAIAKKASTILNSPVNCKDVFGKYTGNSQITELIEQSTDAVIELIANIKAITGTSTLVLGGSVGSAPLFRNQILQKIKKLPEIYQLEVLPPKSGSNADLMGVYYFVAGE